MYSRNRHHTHITKTGAKVVVVPRPILLEVKVENGRPVGVKGHSATFATLKGINHEDYHHIKPDLVIYELGDGSLLQATPAVFERSDMAKHDATKTYQPCYDHLVSHLQLVEEMPEFEEPEIIQF